MYDRQYDIPPGYIQPIGYHSAIAADETSRASLQNNQPSAIVAVNRRSLWLEDHDDQPPAPPPHRLSYAAFKSDIDPAILAHRDRRISITPGTGNRSGAPPSMHTPDYASVPLDIVNKASPDPKAKHYSHDSQNSLTPLMSAQHGQAARSVTPVRPYSGAGSRDYTTPGSAHYYHGDGYDDFDPWTIADDDEDDLQESGSKSRSNTTEAPTGNVASIFGGLVPRKVTSTHGSAAHVQDPEKSEWLHNQDRGSRSLRWIVGSVVVILLLGAIIGGGIAGGILSRHNHHADASSGKSNGSSGSSGSSSNGLWTIQSPEIQAVLNDKNLHKVFPGMDYTPTNGQYPACLTNPIDQNNVTLDMAILSQLTPAVRLYGTDCAQTEAVLTGINQLGFNDSMQVWLGVYLGLNKTTNTRQLSQMYTLLATNPTSRFAGIIIGNEVIFEGSLTATELGTILDDVRANITALNLSSPSLTPSRLPLATSQLGDAWTAAPELAAHVDIVMANVHPFFAGVAPAAGRAAAWAWEFWATNDLPLTGTTPTASTSTEQLQQRQYHQQHRYDAEDGVTDSGATAVNGTWPRQVISEIGWPTAGGRDCGDAESISYGCVNGTGPVGAVANLTNLNVFLESWVCLALANTTYFWFEAFDEPWKEIYDTEYDHWEPHWGLFDHDRNLKPGITIPDCDGKTVDNAYGT